MHRRPPRWRPDRRGVTLIEMMITVALVILIMTIIVSVFRSATGAVRGAQVANELDGSLRRLEATIRQDLNGATASFTPPLDPKSNLGYFEYGENASADLQEEDTDDWMAFTVGAPEGQPFVGRYWDPAGNQAIQPITITSQYAEVLYFLRNGNLYRRVLLIVPERAGQLATGTSFTLGANTGMPMLASTGQAVSWRAVNDISARPAPSFPFTSGSVPAPIPNTLGDLTNRENRIFRPRFNADFVNITQTGAGTQPEAKPDDFGGLGTATTPLPDGIADYYPTLYPNVLSTGLINTVAFSRSPTPTLDTMPFPFIFPGAYSVADFPNGSSPNGEAHFIGVTSGANTITNHSPVTPGDNLPIPIAGLSPNQLQTYWSWPTWKETLSPNWTDPVLRLVDNTSPTSPNQSTGLSWANRANGLLPPMTSAYRIAEQPFNDGLGGIGANSFAPPPLTGATSLWFNAWEDDLIMTGVRSFDIKAFDPTAGPAGGQGAFVDLGYLNSTTSTSFVQLAGFGHEGRMPPLTADNRPDAKWPYLSANIGENSNSTLRMRRVWCSWSTAYSNAPDLPLDPSLGPLNGQPPVYPSYPPPYPAPLRAIQIQIRVVNQPDSDRVRVLTIRQDFSDKL